MVIFKITKKEKRKLKMFKLSNMFTDHMVLQRNKEIRVYGTGDEVVTVELDGAIVKAELCDGKWIARLPQHKEGGPYQLKISGENDEIILEDVLIGDVWVASGQSNIEYPMVGELRGVREAERANNQNIRLFTCSRFNNFKNIDRMVIYGDVVSDRKPWEIVSPESVIDFSAVGYFFAERIQKETNVPIGIISANRGGCIIEAFVSEESYKEEVLKDYMEEYQREKLVGEEEDEVIRKYEEDTMKAIGEYEKLGIEPLKTMGVSAGREYARKYPMPMLTQMCRENPNAPSKQYDILIKSQLEHMSVCGLLWYQGESNVGDKNYADKFKLLARDWRTAFEDEELPIYTVEIVSYATPGTEISGSAIIRQEQWRATRIVPNTHIITTQDIGDVYDIHPYDKYDLSIRLANQVLNYSYGIKSYCECPSYRCHEIVGDKVYITLDNDDGFFGEDLYSNMRICGQDGVYKVAESKYENGKLVVWNEEIKEPKNVRYSFDNSYPRGKYFNKAGLPLAPFTTEDYRG